MTSVHSTYGQHERTESVKCAVFQFISVIQIFLHLPCSQVESYCSVRMTCLLPRLRKKAESRLMKSEVMPAYSSPSAQKYQAFKNNLQKQGGKKNFLAVTQPEKHSKLLMEDHLM